MAESLNTTIADALTARDLQARRVEAALRREVWAHLALLEAEIVAAVKTTDPTEFVLLSRRRREVETLMHAELDPLIQARYQAIAALLDAALLRLARQEAGAVQTIVNAATEEATVTDLPSDRQLRAGVVQGLFPSAATPTDLSTTGSDWWTRQGESVALRLGDSLMVGVSLEESLTPLTQRITGTSDTAFKDGLMEKARQDASRLLTTQMTNAVSEARVAVAGVNAAQVQLVHVSILDTATSLTCFARHGKRFTADTHEPIGHTLPFLTGVPYHPS